MIDFRYHLVSIVAVFLALAFGIVLGSTELQGPVYNMLNGETASMKSQLNTATNERQAAEQELAADNAWIQANETAVLHDMLTGQRIVIVTEPGAQTTVVDGVTEAAKLAGATVTDVVNLQSKFFDTTNTTADTLSQMNATLAQNDQIQLDASAGSPQQGAAQVLASEILTTPGAVQSGATGAQSVLASYAGANFLTASNTSAAQATLAVIVTPQTIPADESVDPLAQDLGPFAQELAKVKTTPTVVVGSAAGSVAGSPIAVLRGTDAANQVSTVDDADTTRGQVTAMQALRIELNGGSPGSYGIDSGSTYPSVTPSASASATAPASPGSTKKPRK